MKVIQLLILAVMTNSLCAQTMFATSRDDNTIEAIDFKTGVFLGTVIPSGEGGLSLPQEVIHYKDSEILVTGRGNQHILKFDVVDGVYLEDFTSGYQLDNPTKTRLGPDGLLYVSQWVNTGKPVVRFNYETGGVVDEFTSIGIPHGMGQTWDSLGNLYVTTWGDGSDGLVLRFDIEGEFIDTAINSDILDGPVNLWTSDSGTVFVIDWTKKAVLEFNLNGELLQTLFLGGHNLEGFVFDGTNDLYVAQWSGGGIYKYQISEKRLNSFVSPGTIKVPNSIAIADFNLSIANEDELPEISVFPNPSIDILHVKNANTSSYAILTIEGRVVKRGRLTSNIEIIPVHEFHKGVYFLDIFNDAKTKIRKSFIKL